MTIEEKRRELFEAQHHAEVERLARIYGAQPSLDVAYDRDENGLYLSGVVQAAWWGFNAALDAVVIELPDSLIPVDAQERGWEMMGNVRAAIESTGLGLKVKP